MKKFSMRIFNLLNLKTLALLGGVLLSPNLCASNLELTSAEDQVKMVLTLDLPRSNRASYMAFEGVFDQNVRAIQQVVGEKYPDRLEKFSKFVNSARAYFKDGTMNSMLYMHIHWNFSQYISNEDKSVIPVYLDTSISLEELEENATQKGEGVWEKIDGCVYLPIVAERPLFEIPFMNRCQTARILLVGIPLSPLGFDGGIDDEPVDFVEHDLVTHGKQAFKKQRHLMPLREQLYGLITRPDNSLRDLDEFPFFMVFHETLLVNFRVDPTFDAVQRIAVNYGINNVYSPSMYSLVQYWTSVIREQQGPHSFGQNIRTTFFDENSTAVDFKYLLANGKEYHGFVRRASYESIHGNEIRAIQGINGEFKKLGFHVPITGADGKFNAGPTLALLQQELIKFFNRYRPFFQSE